MTVGSEDVLPSAVVVDLAEGEEEEVIMNDETVAGATSRSNKESSDFILSALQTTQTKKTVCCRKDCNL